MMELESGRMLAHYRLAEKIGEGGMGAVYRARDTKLDRDVALKILPQAFTTDADRMTRFAREAQVLASLNHPHVGAIYGLEDQDGIKALVLELIDGEDLNERLAGGTIPLDQALGIAMQIAEGMEAAHEKGIIHRDLKPANVKITTAGKVKVLDFGLAKAMTDPASSPELSLSPTLTIPATQAGVIMGTASYMAPEQARGRTADKRSDVWAFGVILYEMVVGGRLFAGETVTDILAAVIRAEPDLDKVPANAPPALRRLLRRCLAKNPARRLRDFGDVRLELQEAIEAPAEQETASVSTLQAAPMPAWKRALSIGFIVALLAAAATTGFITSGLMQDAPLVHASVLPPEETSFSLDSSSPGVPAISPDGTRITFSAIDGEGIARLYVRSLDASKAYVLSGTGGAGYPFWSPNSQSIGFFVRSENALKKIAATGGPALTLCESPNGKGGTWGSDGTIIFAASHDSGLFTVRDSGGIPQPLTELISELNDNSHRHPFLLPGGRHFLYLARGRKTETESGALMIGSLDQEDEDKFLMSTKAGVVYSSGHLLFLNDRVLMAQPFDTDSLELTGDPFPIAEDILYIGGAAKGVFSASDNGSLIYVGGIHEIGRTLAWVDTEGIPQGTLGEEAAYRRVMLSPDGKFATTTVLDEAQSQYDIWIFEIERGLGTRFTFSSEDEHYGTWSPDSKRLYFTKEIDEVGQIFVKPIGGTGSEELVYESDKNKYPGSISPDGKHLTFSMTSTDTGVDVWVLPLSSDKEPYIFAGGEFSQHDGMFSPDGRWMAYMSDESKRAEVYVTPFPDPGRKWQVSTDGGDNPIWSLDGKKLYFQGRGGAVTVVDIDTSGDTLVVGAPQVLFERPPSGFYYRYSPAPAGDQFLVVESSQRGGSLPLSLVLNWPRQVER